MPNFQNIDLWFCPGLCCCCCSEFHPGALSYKCITIHQIPTHPFVISLELGMSKMSHITKTFKSTACCPSQSLALNGWGLRPLLHPAIQRVVMIHAFLNRLNSSWHNIDTWILIPHVIITHLHIWKWSDYSSKYVHTPSPIHYENITSC